MGIQDLPVLNASLNATSAVLIVAGYICIKRGHMEAHKKLMGTALVVSTLFLISYLTFHFFGVENKFQGTGWIRTLYFTMLISHIILAVVIVPMVLRTVYLGLRDRRNQHVKIGRWTLALWLYVSITGVLVYLSLY